MRVHEARGDEAASRVDALRRWTDLKALLRERRAGAHERDAPADDPDAIGGSARVGVGREDLTRALDEQLERRHRVRPGRSTPRSRAQVSASS